MLIQFSHIYAQGGEGVNKWMAGLKQTLAANKIIMEISLLVMEKSWNNHGIWILNFCGNPDQVYKL